MQRLPLLLTVLSLLAPVPAFSQDAFDFKLPGEGKSDATKASLVSEVSGIAPGQTFTVALHLEHPDEWHSYYRNSGGTEKSPVIKWTLPEGFTAGEMQWPVPEVKEGFFGKSFAYDPDVSLLVDITPPATLPASGSVSLKADAEWQICHDSCKDEKASLTLELPVSAAAKPDAAQADFFKAARAKLPAPTGDWKFAAERTGNVMSLVITPPAGTAAPAKGTFIPDVNFIAGSDPVTLPSTDGVLRLPLPGAKDPISEKPIPAGDNVSGIFVPEGGPAVTVPPTPLAKAAPASVPWGQFLTIALGLFTGGLILNLMPCVFPVIGLKIMGFVRQSGHDRGKIVKHGLMFALGVLVSFWVLSGVLFFLRSAATGGGDVGWGYQLQNPWIVCVLMLLMFVLALSMYGVFEIGVSATTVGGELQDKSGVTGTFFSGVLATVVATPCSAPFLGVALGAAVGLPALQFFLAFTIMALGLATPYLLLSIFPSLVKKLPKPGPWMESFKQAMSFLLFATAGYLLWVYGSQIQYENLLGPIAGLSLIAIAAWVFGRWAPPSRKPRTRRLGWVFTLIFAAAGLWACTPPRQGVKWEHWSQARVDELLAEGRPVYVDFTATWCATCQVNKKNAYPAEIVELMKRKDVVALKADKSSPDPAIEAKLQEFGLTAIPVNVLYEPEKDPVVTPTLLTPGYLKELFSALPAPGAADDEKSEAEGG